MSLLSWNCRGLGNLQIFNALKKVIRIEKPNIVFLMEKKSDVDWMKIVRDHNGFKESYIVPSDGSSGGLALFWNSEIKMQVLSSSLSYIDGIVNEGSTSNKWHMIGFYGNLDTSRRVESWKLLNSLFAVSPLPWLVIGDFNEIKLASEKEGGALRPKQQMAHFNSIVNSCGLREVEHVGLKFTWIYQRSDGYQIRERLDRALVNSDWTSMFPSEKLLHKSSSHQIIVL